MNSMTPEQALAAGYTHVGYPYDDGSDQYDDWLITTAVTLSSKQSREAAWRFWGDGYLVDPEGAGLTDIILVIPHPLDASQEAQEGVFQAAEVAMDQADTEAAKTSYQEAENA